MGDQEKGRPEDPGAKQDKPRTQPEGVGAKYTDESSIGAQGQASTPDKYAVDLCHPIDNGP